MNLEGAARIGHLPLICIFFRLLSYKYQPVEQLKIQRRDIHPCRVASWSLKNRHKTHAAWFAFCGCSHHSGYTTCRFFEDVPRNVPTLWILARGWFVTCHPPHALSIAVYFTNHTWKTLPSPLQPSIRRPCALW
jgi:hypothetical protein